MILTAGCSFTYGDELDNRLEQAWPYLLGHGLDLAVDNIGQCGNSNNAMVRQVISCLGSRQYRLVVVAWTDISRVEVWDESIHQPNTIMPGSRSALPWVTDYYRYSYNDQYALTIWAQQVLLLQSYLKSIDQPYLFVNLSGFESLNSRLDYIWRQLDTDRFVGWFDAGQIQFAADAPKGPGGHPLALGHERIANEIAKYIRN